MNNFKEAYKDAVKDIAQPNIDAQSVLDEVRRRKVRKRQSIQKCATVASMMLLVCVGGLTTVKAADYLGSIIRVGDRGFVSGDIYTMTDTVPASGEAGATADGGDAQVAVAKVMPAEAMAEEPVVMEMEDIPEARFESVDAFRKECTDVVIALPDVELTESGFESVNVVGDSVFVRFQVSEEKSVDVHRHDYSDSQGHVASISFPGEICNERSYTTGQGFTYTLIDEVQTSEEEPMRIHSAISVESYEIYMNFYGYEEEEVLELLESVDMEIYCG